MEPETWKPSDADMEKVKWVEEQANKVLNFGFESREIVIREAHTTLRWLVVVILGALGFAVHLAPAPWTVGPLAAVALIASAMAIHLVLRGLILDSICPPGNEPRNIATSENLERDEYTMRLAEVLSLQERITENRQDNRKIGGAVNQARCAVICLIPLAVVAIVAGFLRLG